MKMFWKIIHISTLWFSRDKLFFFCRHNHYYSGPNVGVLSGNWLWLVLFLCTEEEKLGGSAWWLGPLRGRRWLSNLLGTSACGERNLHLPDSNRFLVSDKIGRTSPHVPLHSGVPATRASRERRRMPFSDKLPPPGPRAFVKGVWLEELNQCSATQ